jgi:hypothetical protein
MITKKEAATFMRERGLSDKIQQAVNKHNLSNPDNRMTLSDFINQAIKEKLKQK